MASHFGKYGLNGLKFKPESGLNVDLKSIHPNKERKKNFVITSDPSLLFKYWLTKMSDGAVQATFTRLSVPICDLMFLNKLEG